MFERPLLHDFRGPQPFTTVNHRHPGGEFSEKQGLFHGRIATTNDDDFLAPEEKTITGGAGGDAVAYQAFFSLQPEPACRGTRGNNQGLCVQSYRSDLEPKGALGQIDACHVVHVQFRTEAGRLFAKNLHHIGPQNTIGEARVVFDFCGQSELTAGLAAFEYQRGQIGACRVNTRGQPGGTRADNDNFVVTLQWHRVSSSSVHSVATGLLARCDTPLRMLQLSVMMEERHYRPLLVPRRTGYAHKDSPRWYCGAQY